jgi:adenosylcobinamide kinase / adenosylcobinamide-phosphate guanylyltransferase
LDTLSTMDTSFTFNRTLANRSLILGGARSGKSSYAESLAQTLANPTLKQVIYIATAKAPRADADSEMQARIAHHQARRNPAWQTLEVPLLLGEAIETHSKPECVIVVDCLTVWLSNLLFNASTTYPEVGIIDLPADFLAQRQALLDGLSKAKGDIVLVSNEVGMGIVPMGAINRLFVDEAGRLNQAVAAVCDRVVFVAAGCPLVLKGTAL